MKKEIRITEELLIALIRGKKLEMVDMESRITIIPPAYKIPEEEMITAFNDGIRVGKRLSY